MRRALFLGLLLAHALACFTSVVRAAPGDRRSLTLRGRVTDASGAPIADATITATGRHALSTVANADGRYSLHLELGSVADLARAPHTLRVEAKQKGKRIPVAGGVTQLELSATGVADAAGQTGLRVSSNLPALATQLERDFAREGDVDASITLDFSRARSTTPPASVADAAPTAVAAVPVAPPVAPKAAAAPPNTPAPSAVPPPAVASTPTTTGAPPPAVAGAAAAAAAPIARKKPKSRPASALDVLEASKGTGSIIDTRAVRDSVRDAQRRQERAAEARERAEHDAQKARQKAETQRAAFVRDSLATEQRLTRARTSAQRDAARERERDVALRLETARLDSMRIADHTRDSLDTMARAERAARDAVRRDSLKLVQRERDLEREQTRIEQIQHQIFRRDSAYFALRTRDSLRAVARAAQLHQDSLRTAARRDSLRAVRVQPVLDPRPPIGGRPAGEVAVSVSAAAANGVPVAAALPIPACLCRVRGTIELRSEKRLSQPLTVEVGVRGNPTTRVSVPLFMGSMREFVLQNVACGSIELEVLIPAGRRFAVAERATLGPADCSRGGLWQPRMVLVPN